MGAVWHKDRYLPSDLDRDGYPLPGVMPVGLWCEDRETSDDLLMGARMKGMVIQPEVTDVPARISGMPIYVATPVQADFLRAMPTVSPEEHAAARQAEFEAASRAWGELAEKMGLAKPEAGQTTHEARQPVLMDPPKAARLAVSSVARISAVMRNRLARRAEAAKARRKS